MISWDVHSTPSTPSRGTPVRQIAVAVILSWCLIFVVSLGARLWPPLAPHAGSLVAAIFIYIPVLMAWRRRDLWVHLGLGWGVPTRVLAQICALVISIFLLFSAGFFMVQEFWYGRDLPSDGDLLWEIPPRYDLDPDAPLEGIDDLVVGRTRPKRVLVFNGSREARSLTIRGGEAIAEWSLGEGGLLDYVGPAVPEDSPLLPGRLWSVPWSGRDPGFTIEGTGQIAEGASGERVSLPLTPKAGLGWLLVMVLVQLFMVALPEELFYRGFLQPRLDALFCRRWKVLNGDVGPATLVTSALFAIGHLVTIPSAHRLAVFFPSLLFGWLYTRTGSIWPGVLVHALSNVLLTVLYRFVGL
jgi:membrane protease YdiL (CAAX protease family)